MLVVAGCYACAGMMAECDAMRDVHGVYPDLVSPRPHFPP